MNHLWNSAQYVKTSDLQATVADDLINDLEIKPDENLLDIGCGLGNITMSIASIAYKGHVLGIDASPSMIEKAKENLLLRRSGNIGYQVMSATELQFNGQFDVVFSNSVLHWIKQQEVALRSIHRCLNAGGRIGLQFPLLDSSHPMVKLVHEAIHALQLDQKYAAWLFPWYVPESADSYVNLLKQISFKDVNVREVETCYTFETILTAFGFFNSVGFELYLQPLSQADGTLLKDEFLKFLERYSTKSGVRLNFRRMYVRATL